MDSTIDPTPPWTATNSAGYRAPAALAVDVVVLTVRDGRLLALTLATPDGRRALPGGLVGTSEAPQDTAARKLAEKTGVRRDQLEQLATFAAPDRDPRGWIPSVAHLALVPPDTEPAESAAWAPAEAPPALIHDHAAMLALALERTRGKLWWSNVAVGILDATFTLARAREVYEAIANTRYDPSTFARDLRGTGLISAVDETRSPTGGRPAALYRFTASAPHWGAGRRKRIPG